MGMFTAYFDASGDDHCQAALAMAGFVAPVDAWIEWEKEWISRLARDGLTYFHRNEISSWATHKRQALINDLCGLIRSYVSSKTGIVVVNKYLQQFVSQAQRKHWHLRAYSLTGRTVAKEMRIWASEWRGPMPELIFEDGDKGKGSLIDLMRSDGYPSPIFKPKKTYIHKKSKIEMQGSVPLQAADLYAFELFNRARKLQAGGSEDRNFNRIHPELDKIPGLAGVINPDHLKFLDQGISQRDSLIMTTSVKIRAT